MAYTPTYIPPFDFSTLSPGQSATWNEQQQQWVVYTMEQPVIPPQPPAAQ
jgi:hypothetical protein